MTDLELDILKNKIRERYNSIGIQNVFFHNFYNREQVQYFVIYTGNLEYQWNPFTLVLLVDKSLDPDQDIEDYIMRNYAPQRLEYL